MANPALIGAGIILIMFAFLFYVNNISTLHNAVQTGPGTALENASTAVKQTVGSYDYLIAAMPYLIFFVGAGLMFAGAKGD